MVEEKRWSRGRWNYHLRPGEGSVAALTIAWDDTVVMEVEGSVDFCRALLAASNKDDWCPGDWRCRVSQLD